MGKYKPDAVILLDVSVETAKARNAVKNERDPYDDEKVEYFNRVVSGYRKMAQSNWSGVKWYVINAERRIEEVHDDVRKVLDEIFSLSR